MVRFCCLYGFIHFVFISSSIQWAIDSPSIVSISSRDTRYIAVVYNFIPLSTLASHDVRLTLVSSTFDTIPQEIDFDAYWYVSSTSSARAPLSGNEWAHEELSFSCVADPGVSLRIDGNYRLRKSGQNLPLTISYADVPQGATIVANLQTKSGGIFVDSGDRKAVEINQQGQADISFAMGRMTPGSYRILVTISLNGGNLLQVPYYFIIETP